MKAVSVQPVSVNSEGLEVVDALVVADTAPNPLPTTGADVEGMNADQVFAPFSIIYVVAADAPTKVYIANESGVFIGQ